MNSRINFWINILEKIIFILFLLIPIPDPKVTLLNGMVLIVMILQLFPFSSLSFADFGTLIIGFLGILFLFNKRFYLSILGVLFLNFWFFYFLKLSDFSHSLLFLVPYIMFTVSSGAYIVSLLLRRSKKQSTT